jgi:hypothetical protein
MKKITAILLIMLTSLTCFSQSDLKGKELTKVTDVAAALESGIGLLFGAGKMEGEIEKVEVTDENHKEVKLKVTFSGFEGNWITAGLLASDKSNLAAISSSSVAFPGGSNDIELILTRDTELDSDVESAYLKLLVTKQEKDFTGLVSYYLLPKTWRPAGLSHEAPVYSFINESLVIDVNPVPIGVAARLNDKSAERSLPTPQKRNIIKFDDQIYKSASIRRTQMNPRDQIVPAKKPSDTEAPSPSISPDRRIERPNLSINRDLLNKRPGIPEETPSASTPENQNNSMKWWPGRPDHPTTPLGITPEEKSKGAEGPGYMPITLWDEILTDPGVSFDLSQGYLITNISFDIFPDQNENSGYYYYFPASYALQWNKENAYQFRMLYGSAAEETGEGMVNMYMTITPSISTTERNLVEALVKDYAERHGKPFEKLRPIPLKEPPKAVIQSISDYGVPVERISTAATTSIFDPIQLSWPISSGSSDDFMVALKEIDIRGTLSLIPDDNFELGIPVDISLKNDRTLGRIILRENIWRNQLWKNEMPFPVRLKYIHALFLNKEDSGTTPYIYSWDLGDKEVPVYASVNFNAESIPLMVDRGAQRIWVEYSVSDCPECMDKIINDLMGGTVSAKQQNVEVISYGVIERTGAYVIEVYIRSRLADPKGKSIMEIGPFRLTTDNVSSFVGPLFVPTGKNLEYEYRIRMVTDDEVLNSKWFYATDASLYLTRSVIESVLGKFPEKD